MKRETEVILLALDFYADVRKGEAGNECSKLAKKIRIAEQGAEAGKFIVDSFKLENIVDIDGSQICLDCLPIVGADIASRCASVNNKK